MKTIVIAPHPDDEVLGAGGTLLRRKAEGGSTAWVIVTAITEAAGMPTEVIARRRDEIQHVAERFGFDAVFSLGFPTTQLDRMPFGDVVAAMSDAFQKFQPEEVLLPHRGDAHSDHRVVFDAAAACTKWFRYPSVKRVLAYETLSETDFGLNAREGFRPNVFVDITPHLDAKIQTMSIYASEVGKYPFPRSAEAIRALAQVRGAASGCAAAEGFELLREIS